MLVQTKKTKRQHEFARSCGNNPSTLALDHCCWNYERMSGKIRVALPSTTAAEKSGAFDHGWIPDLLKPDVTDITEWHDIASSEVRGRFALNPGVLNRLKSSCTPATDMPRRTRSMPAWFPVSITSGDAAAQDMSVFRCADFFVALDKLAVAGYFWETNY